MTIASSAMAAAGLIAIAAGAAWSAQPAAPQDVPPGLVRAVQHRLQHMRHYEVGPQTGIYGSSTHAALWYFQAENNLLPTGQMDRETLRALGLAQAAAQMPPARSFGATTQQWESAAGGGFFYTPLGRQ